MAYFGITATEGGLRAAARGEEVEAGLARAARAPAGPDAPIVVLIHGYKFHPDQPTPIRTARSSRCSRRRRLADPELAGGARLRRRRRRERALRRLRLAGERAAPREPPRHRAERLRPGLRARRRLRRPARRAGGALAAAGAGPAGRRARPFARRAGGARRAAAPRRRRRGGWSCSAPPSSAREARGFLAPAARRARPQVYNVTSRANDLYDLMFERFAPRRGRGDRAIGARARRAARRLARPAARPRRGHRLDQRPGHPADRRPMPGSATGASTPARARSRSTRRSCGGGPGWDIAGLRAAACFGAQEPRWSRLLPRRRRRCRGWPRARSRRKSDRRLNAAPAAPCCQPKDHNLEWTDDRTDRALLLADPERLQDHHRAARDGACPTTSTS